MIYVREFGFHSAKGNAATIHFDIVSKSPGAPDIHVVDEKIQAASEQQQGGAFDHDRFECGAVAMPYSIVERVTIIDADGEKSNSIDFPMRCPVMPQ